MANTEDKLTIKVTVEITGLIDLLKSYQTANMVKRECQPTGAWVKSHPKEKKMVLNINTSGSDNVKDSIIDQIKTQLDLYIERYQQANAQEKISYQEIYRKMVYQSFAEIIKISGNFSTELMTDVLKFPIVIGKIVDNDISCNELKLSQILKALTTINRRYWKPEALECNINGEKNKEDTEIKEDGETKKDADDLEDEEIDTKRHQIHDLMEKLEEYVNMFDSDDQLKTKYHGVIIKTITSVLVMDDSSSLLEYINSPNVEDLIKTLKRTVNDSHDLPRLNKIHKKIESVINMLQMYNMVDKGIRNLCDNISPNDNNASCKIS